MVVVMAIDIPMFRGAREIGRIRWGQVSRLVGEVNGEFAPDSFPSSTKGLPQWSASH